MKKGLMSVAVAAAMAWMASALVGVRSPLASWTDYIFAPLNPTNGASIVQGLVMGPGGSYRQVRAEDLAFLDEAVQERLAMMDARWNPGQGTNSVKSLNWANPGSSAWTVQVTDPDDARYLDSQEGLLDGVRVVDPGAPVTNTVSVTRSVPDGTEDYVVTSGWTTVANAYRPDWPPIVTPITQNRTRTKFKDRIDETTQIRNKTWMDCTEAGSNVFVTGFSGGKSPTQIVGLDLPVPTFADVTNLFSILDKTKYLIFKDDLEGQHTVEELRRSIESDVYYDFNVDQDLGGPVPRYELGSDSFSGREGVETNVNYNVIGGVVYSLDGSALKSIDVGYAIDPMGGDLEQGFKPVWATSPQQKLTYGRETYTDTIVVSNIVPHSPTLVTTGGVRRLNTDCSVFQAFELEAFEESLYYDISDPNGSILTNAFPTLSKTFKVLARIDLAQVLVPDPNVSTNLTNVVVVAEIEPKDVFSSISGFTPRWRSLADIDEGKGMVPPQVVSYNEYWYGVDGFMQPPRLNSSSSSMRTVYYLRLLPTQIILFECQFKTDLP